MAKQVGWQLDKMPEKISALATFHGALLNNLSSNPQAYNRIRNAGANIVSKYFNAYVDAVARIDRYRYHHIYEFGMVGDSNARLFKSTVKNGNISYSFIDASKPNNDGFPFSKKAFIMEAGDPIVITPKSGEFLVYDFNGDTIVSRRSVVDEPGGPYVAGAFRSIFEEFFKSGMPNKALREFGFYNTIEKGIEAETKKVSPRINAGAFNSSAQMAAQAAYGIAGKVEEIDNRL
jgi:hypothetical protein